MFKKINIFFPITLLLFIAIEVYLMKNRAFQTGILFYVVYCGFLFFIDKKYIITFFVFQLPLFPLVPTDFKVLNYIGPHEIVYGFSIFTLLLLSAKLKLKENEFQRLSIKFIYLLFFIESYINIKDMLLGISTETEIIWLIKTVVRAFLYYYPLVLLVRLIYLKGYFNYVKVGIEYSLVVLVISMVFTPYLRAWNITQLFVKNFSIYQDIQTRFLGIWGAGGDVNSAGIFLVGLFGFLLALYERDMKIKRYIIFFGFAIFGILMTGSRTAFMALSTVLLIFMITNKSGKAKFTLIIACIIFYFAFSKQLDVVIERFLDPSAKQAIDPNDTGRVGKWIRYMGWILDNPETLLFGNQVNINYHRAPHNYFIYILYHAGLVPLFIFFQLLFKLMRYIKFSVSSSTLKNAYYIIPFPFILMTVSSFGSAIYLWLYLPLGAYFLANTEK